MTGKLSCVKCGAMVRATYDKMCLACFEAVKLGTSNAKDAAQERAPEVK